MKNQKYIFLSGQKINNLTLIAKDVKNKRGENQWRFLCHCGKEGKATAYNVHKIKSCGCLKLSGFDFSSKYGVKTDDMPEYNVWTHMKKRCSGNSKNKRDASYVARGIKVCERWQNSFAAFYEDMGPRPSSKHSLDRIDNNGNYEPKNCRWATTKEQANNTSKNISISFNGETKTLTQWAEFLGVNLHSLRCRLVDYGYSIEEAFNEPYIPRETFCPKEFTIDGETLPLDALCKKYNLTKKEVRSRFHKGWDCNKIFKTPIVKKQNPVLRELTLNEETLSIEDWSRKTGIKKQEIRKRISRGWNIERALTQPMRNNS